MDLLSEFLVELLVAPWHGLTHGLLALVHASSDPEVRSVQRRVKWILLIGVALTVALGVSAWLV